MDPSTTKKKPKPIIAILAVVIPLAAIGAAAVVTTSGSRDGSATATTISQDGDPEATAQAGGPKADDANAKDAAAEGTSPGGAKTTAPSTTASTEPETPSRPTDTGTEGERTSVTYPQPTVPSSGCSTRSGTAVITLGSTPSPACLKLSADQPVVVRNRTGKEISFIAISINEVVAAGSEMRLGMAGDAFGDGRSTFWSPGNPQLSGIVVVG